MDRLGAFVDLDRVDYVAVRDALNGDEGLVAYGAGEADDISVDDGEADIVDGEGAGHDGAAYYDVGACYVVAKDAYDAGAYSLVDVHTYFVDVDDFAFEGAFVDDLPVALTRHLYFLTSFADADVP